MKCRFHNKFFRPLVKGFTLAETLAALAILGLIASSIFVVISRCMNSAAEEKLRMQAFEVARENMEKLLALDSVPEMVEYGTSERYPEIKWQKVVETFSGPIGSKTWLKAVCSSEYIDTEGETQTIELEHWLGELSEDDLAALEEESEEESEEVTRPKLPDDKDAPLCERDINTLTMEELLQFIKECM